MTMSAYTGIIFPLFVICSCSDFPKIKSAIGIDTAYIQPVKTDTITKYEATVKTIDMADSLIARLHHERAFVTKHLNKEEGTFLSSEAYKKWLFDKALTLEDSPVSFTSNGKRYLLVRGRSYTAPGLASNFYFWYLYDEANRIFLEPIWSLNGDLKSFFYKNGKLHIIVVDYSHWVRENRDNIVNENINTISLKEFVFENGTLVTVPVDSMVINSQSLTIEKYSEYPTTN